MPRLLSVLAVLVAAACLAGCATLSRSECETGDWRSLGIGDGAHGYPVSRFGRHVKACARYDIAPNKELYLAGREEGLILYCRLERAALAGTRGNPNYKVCAGELGVSFNRVYEKARHIFRLRENAADIRSEMNDVADKIAMAGTSAARAALARELRDLSEDLSDNERAINRAQSELRALINEETSRLAALGIKG